VFLYNQEVVMRTNSMLHSKMEKTLLNIPIVSIKW